VREPREPHGRRVVGGGRDRGEIERAADAVVSGRGEGPPRGAWINEPRVSSEGTLDGLGSCAHKEAGDRDGDGDGDGDGPSAVGRCALGTGEGRTWSNSLTRSGGCVTLAFRGYAAGDCRLRY